MSELPGDSVVPDMSTMNGVSDVLQAGGGVGRRRPEARQGQPAGASRAMARTPGLAPRLVPGGMAGLMAMPHMHCPLRFLELQEQRMFHHYLHSTPLIPVRLLRDIEERRRLFVEGCKAREAAFDADPPQMDSHARAFTLALTAPHTRGPE